MSDQPAAPQRTPVAVVGCGYWGKNLVRNFAELGVLSAVCDASETVAKGLAELHQAAARAWREIVADPEIQAIAIAAPAAQHGRLAREALEAGKHVFVEKPLALNLDEGEQLCELAAQRGRRLMVGHLLQYHPAFLKLRDLIDQGVLGRIQYIYSNRLNLGKFRREEDILWSFAPHDISMILALVGAEPNQVTAQGAYYLHDSIADVTTTHLAFPGGQRAHIFVSWLHPFKEQKLIVVGDNAMAVFDDGEPWGSKLRLYPHRIEWRHGMPVPSKANAEPVALDEAEPLKMELVHFLDSVANGTVPRTDGQEGLRVLRVLQAAAQSLRDAAGPEPRSGPSDGTRFPGVTVHDSAYVDEGVEIGPGTKVWHYSHILPGCRIGRGVIVGQNVMIGPDVEIGDRCKIQNNVSVYKGVTLEEGVFCGPSCVFTNVMTPRAEVERKDEFRPTLVRRGATIGANATIVCGVTLGEYCFIGAGAVVTRDVPPFAVMTGVPARRVGWASHAGERLGPDLVCPRTGRRYQEKNQEQLEEIIDDPS